MQETFGTDWNKHHGAGETLLHNWSEERVVGGQILEERRNKKLARRGHKNLLSDPTAPSVNVSTHTRDFEVPPRPALEPKGAQRATLERAWMQQAIQETEAAATQRREAGHAKEREWASCYTATIGGAVGPGKGPQSLAANPPSEEERRKFNTPISFWSDYAGKGSGTAICSQRAQHLQARAHAGEGQADPACIGHRAIQRYGDQASGVSVRFPKDVTFSTPIASSLQPHKE